MKHSIVTITIISCISGQLWGQYDMQIPGNAEKLGEIYSKSSSDHNDPSQYDNFGISNQNINDPSDGYIKSPSQQQRDGYPNSNSFNPVNIYSKSSSGNSDNSQYNDFDINKQGTSGYNDNYNYPSSQRQRGGYPNNNRHNPGSLGDFSDIYSKSPNDRSGPSQYGEQGPRNKDTDGIYNGDYPYPWQVQPGNYPMAPQLSKYSKNNRQNSGNPESIYSKSLSDRNDPSQYQQPSSNKADSNIHSQVSSQKQKETYPNNSYNPGNSGNPGSIYSKFSTDHNGPSLNYKGQSKYSQPLSPQSRGNYPGVNNHSQEVSELDQDDYISAYNPSLGAQRGNYPNSSSENYENDSNHDRDDSPNEEEQDSYESYNYGPNIYGHNSTPQQAKLSDSYVNENSHLYRPDKLNPSIKFSGDYANNNNDRHRGGKLGSTSQPGESYDNESDYSNAQSKHPYSFDNSNNGEYINKNNYPNRSPSSGQLNPQTASFANNYANENIYRYSPGGRTTGIVGNIGGNPNSQYGNSDPQYSRISNIKGYKDQLISDSNSQYDNQEPHYSRIGNIQGYKDQLGFNPQDNSINNNPENSQSQQPPSNNPGQNQQNPINNPDYGKNIINGIINHPTVSRIGKLFGVGGFLSVLEQH